MKFAPELFPQGTIFEVNEDVGIRPTREVYDRSKDVTSVITDYDQPPTIRFEAVRVQRNGVRSYVIKTAAPGHVEGMNASFNTDHVARIIKRGEGPTKIDYTRFGSVKDVLEDHRMHQSGWFGAEHTPSKSAHTHYMIISSECLITFLIYKNGLFGPWVFDTARAARALMKESFVHCDRLGLLRLHYAPKKRVNAWFKANRNRFLAPIKAAEKEERKMYEDDYADVLSLDDDPIPAGVDFKSVGAVADSQFDADWKRGEDAYANGVSPQNLEDALKDEHEDGKMTTLRADNIRYGYDHARRNSTNESTPTTVKRVRRTRLLDNIRYGYDHARPLSGRFIENQPDATDVAEQDGSCYDDYADRMSYADELEYEAEKKSNRAAKFAQKLPRRAPSEEVNTRGQIDTFSAEVTQRLAQNNFELLADGYIDGDDGFPSMNKACYHRSLVFHLKGKALLLTVKPYAYTHDDGSGGSPAVAVYLVQETYLEHDPAPGADPISVHGFHGCGHSRGWSEPDATGRRRWEVSIPFEDNVYGKGLPDVEAFVASLLEAVGSPESVCDAPFVSTHVWMGNYVDHSGWFSANGGHTKTYSHVLFWNRTKGGKGRILKVAPGASFTKIYPQEEPAGPVIADDSGSPEHPRYHGFTCPKCGSHLFGTYTHYAMMGQEYPAGTKIGHCNEHGHTGNGCTFKWNRDIPEQEAACMYTQTPEEWEAARQQTLRTLLALDAARDSAVVAEGKSI